jgi:hypothetical protein
MTRAKTEQAGEQKKAAGASKERAEESAKGSVNEAKGKPVRNLRFHTKRLIAKEFSEIMESMAEKSKAGSLAHAKFLFEIGGVKEDLAQARRGKAEPSMADLLMGGIKLRQEAHAAELAESLRAEGASGLSGDEDDEDRDEGAGKR